MFWPCHRAQETLEPPMLLQLNIHRAPFQMPDLPPDFDYTPFKPDDFPEYCWDPVLFDAEIFFLHLGKIAGCSMIADLSKVVNRSNIFTNQAGGKHFDILKVETAPFQTKISSSHPCLSLVDGWIRSMLKPTFGGVLGGSQVPSFQRDSRHVAASLGSRVVHVPPVHGGPKSTVTCTWGGARTTWLQYAWHLWWMGAFMAGTLATGRLFCKPLGRHVSLQESHQYGEYPTALQLNDWPLRKYQSCFCRQGTAIHHLCRNPRSIPREFVSIHCWNEAFLAKSL